MPNGEDMKRRIRDGEILIGVSAPLTASKSEMEDILGKDDYAFVHTDSQHSAFNEETLVQFCGYAAELDIPVQFRIKHTRHAYLIGNLLDLGPAGIEVPQVEELSVAQEAVDYFYYPQFGKRSWGRRGALEGAGQGGQAGVRGVGGIATAGCACRWSPSKPQATRGCWLWRAWTA